jgi:hypothetical protein
MKNLLATPGIGKAILLSFFFFNLFALSAKAGIDSYDIYLNNKLLIHQSMAEPFNLKDLPLTEANAGDKLVIRYSQCNAPGKTGRHRSISVKDAGGRIVKEWKFSDAVGSNAEMVIPVKELLQIRKSATGTLSLCYSADEHKGQELATLKRA